MKNLIWPFIAKFLKPFAKPITIGVGVVTATAAALEEQIFPWMCDAGVKWLEFACDAVDSKTWMTILSVIPILTWLSDKLDKHVPEGMPAEYRIGSVDLPIWGWIVGAFVAAFILMAVISMSSAIATVFGVLVVFTALFTFVVRLRKE